MKLIIRDVPEPQWPLAIAVVKRFRAEYPDKMGFHQCVFYMPEDDDKTTLIVYRTKTSIVVRGT